MHLKRTILWLTCAAMLLPAALSWAGGKDCGDGIFSTICSKFKSLETLEISAPDRFLYGIIDASVSGRFPQVLCKVRSLYGGQALSGELRALATFHKRTDYQPDLSTDPPTASSREVAFTVAASEPITGVILSAGEATEFAFYFPSPGIEAGITDLRFAVFFKGFSQGGGNAPVTAYGTKEECGNGVAPSQVEVITIKDKKIPPRNGPIMSFLMPKKRI